MTSHPSAHGQSLLARFRRWAADHEACLALNGFSRRLWWLHAALAVLSFIGALATVITGHPLPVVLLVAPVVLSLAVVVELNLPRHPLSARAVTASVVLGAVLVMLAAAFAVAG